MASVRARSSKGGETTYQVLFRVRGRQSSRTFGPAPGADPAKYANDFRAVVDAIGGEKALELLGGEAPGLTVAELAERFLEHKGRRNKDGGLVEVTDRTLAQYRRDVDNWILPWFGNQSASLVDERAVQKWVDHMTERLSPKSIADRHMLLHAMFDFGRAKSRQLVDHNPCKETELPRRKKRRPKGTTVPEFAAILEAARKRNPAAADLVTFLGETGWRFSEATALPAVAVEDDGTDVWVTVTQVHRQDAGGRQVLAVDEAKSWAAFRRIRMFPDAAAVLRRRLVGLGPTDLVLTNSAGRAWNQNTFLRDTWPGILKAAGLWKGSGKSPTPHWLRHMHVAVCIASGASLPEIQRRIGHESIGTTIDVYGSGIGDVSADAIAKADAIMHGRSGPLELGDVVAGELQLGDG